MGSYDCPMPDPFPSFDARLLALETAAHTSAFGFNQKRPTQAQCEANSYKVGRFVLHGLKLCIEQPRGSVREGVGPDGKAWRSVMLGGHYGYLQGTQGADGDAVDCFVGSYVDSKRVFVINQAQGGQFDEHKVMLCYPDQATAQAAYLSCYERGWQGLQSIHSLSLSQLAWWLKYADTRKPLDPTKLPYDKTEETRMQRKHWDDQTNPIGESLDALLYGIRQADGDGLLLDSVTCSDIVSDPENESTYALDALVTPYAQVERKMKQLQLVMDRITPDLKTVAMQVSDPFKRAGTVNVAVVYELSDGQTVSVYLHNPDTTPAKLAPGDDLISWKWLLNKKDITIVVAPEKGSDLNPREVSRRIMKLAAKNSAAFARANSKRAENLAEIDGLKSEISELEAELSREERNLELAKMQAEEREANGAKEGEQGDDDGLVPDDIGSESDRNYLNGYLLKIKQLRTDLDAKGVSYPSPEQFMQDVNNGDRMGVSVEKLKASLSENEDELRKVQAGTLAPRKVLGTGATKKGAIAYLEDSIALGNFALASGGFKQTTNAYNYLSTLKSIEKSGTDDGLIDHEARAQKKAAQEQYQKEREAENEALKAKAEANMEYEAGTLEGMKEPMTLSARISYDEVKTIADLADKPTAHEKYLYLASKGTTSIKGLEQFKDKVALNSAVKNGATFGHFSIAKRKGYALVEMTIDLKAWEMGTSQILSDLVQYADWRMSNTGGFVQKMFDGVVLPGEFSDGSRIYSATISADKQFVVLQSGFEDPVKQEIRKDWTPRDVAMEFDSKVNEYVRGLRNALLKDEARGNGDATGLVDDDGQPITNEAAQKAKVIVDLLVSKHGFTKAKDDPWYRIKLFGPYSKLSAVTVGVDESNITSLEIEADFVLDFSYSESPEKIAADIAKYDFANAYGDFDMDANLNPTIQDEGSVFFEKSLEFAMAAMSIVEAGADRVGVNVHYGNFADTTSGGLFDSAVTGVDCIYGITAQLHSTGQIWARADIDEAGNVTLLRGASGAGKLGEPKSAQEVADLLSAEIDAWGTLQQEITAQKIADREKEKEKDAEQSAPPPAADNVLTRVHALKKAVPKGAIESSDPQAIEKLKAKYAYLSAYSAMMRDANKLIRKNDRAGLAAMGFPENVITGLFEKDFAGRIGFPDYELKNTNAEARRTGKRIDELTARKAKAGNPVSKDEEGAGQEAETDPPASASNPDKATLQSIIDGTTDPLTADLAELEAIYERNADDAEIQALFEQAVNVVMAAESAATASV